jgi:hypothetical protein
MRCDWEYSIIHGGHHTPYTPYTHIHPYPHHSYHLCSKKKSTFHSLCLCPCSMSIYRCSCRGRCGCFCCCCSWNSFPCCNIDHPCLYCCGVYSVGVHVKYMHVCPTRIYEQHTHTHTHTPAARVSITVFLFAAAGVSVTLFILAGG